MSRARRTWRRRIAIAAATGLVLVAGIGAVFWRPMAVVWHLHALETRPELFTSYLSAEPDSIRATSFKAWIRTASGRERFYAAYLDHLVEQGVLVDGDHSASDADAEVDGIEIHRLVSSLDTALISLADDGHRAEAHFFYVSGEVRRYLHGLRDPRSGQLFVSQLPALAGTEAPLAGTRYARAGYEPLVLRVELAADAVKRFAGARAKKQPLLPPERAVLVIIRTRD